MSDERKVTECSRCSEEVECESYPLYTVDELYWLCDFCACGFDEDKPITTSVLGGMFNVLLKKLREPQ